MALLFRDYRLEYEVERELVASGIGFQVITERDAHKYPVVISDYWDGCVLCSEAVECRRKVMARLQGKDRFFKVVVGIDPGPKPGLAVVADGSVVEEVQLPNIYSVREFVDGVARDYLWDVLIVRVGNGDMVNRNRIINSLLDDYRVEMVDEKNTTESITNKDIESAKQIAFSRGNPVREKLNTIVSEGYIREIQRKSRIESQGRITISRELARKVALGEMSMRMAIEASGDGDEERGSD